MTSRGRISTCLPPTATARTLAGHPVKGRAIIRTSRPPATAISTMIHGSATSTPALTTEVSYSIATVGPCGGDPECHAGCIVGGFVYRPNGQNNYQAQYIYGGGPMLPTTAKLVVSRGLLACVLALQTTCATRSSGCRSKAMAKHKTTASSSTTFRA